MWRAGLDCVVSVFIIVFVWYSNWDYFKVRSKAHSYTDILFNLMHSICKPLNRFSPKTLAPQFLGSEKTGEAMWVNYLPKIATQ